LRSWREGDTQALDELVPVVYDELRRLARAHMRSENQRHTLGATGLVHEAWLRLIRLDQMRFEDRQHFFSMASRVMRRVLVDHAREASAAKRGGPGRPLTLEGLKELTAQPSADLLRLNDALRALEDKDERACRIVEMRYFGGLSHEEVASVLDLSKTTVRREWAFAKAFLQRELMSGGMAP
jgi:RNA polymerase sigma factor (TIGR02999 family)